MHRTLALLGIVSLAGCPSTRGSIPSERLYFALEIRQQGELVAKPQLLAETDKVARLTRKRPGSKETDYQLQLVPKAGGGGWSGRFKVALDLSLPSQRAHWDLSLEHGEYRTLKLDSNPAALQVSLLLMKVDSSEFRTLMDLAERDAALTTPHSI